MSDMCAITWLLLVSAFAQSHGSSQKSGPYRSIPKYIVRCEDEAIEFTNDIQLKDPKLRKVSKDKFIYSGMMSFQKELTSNFKLIVDVSVLGNGGWKPNFFSQEFDDICKTLSEYVPTITKDLLQGLNREGEELCPIEKGTYPVNITLSGIQFTHVPTVIYGTFKFVGRIMEEGACVGCMGLVLEMVPRKEKRTNG